MAPRLGSGQSIRRTGQPSARVPEAFDGSAGNGPPVKGDGLWLIQVANASPPALGYFLVSTDEYQSLKDFQGAPMQDAIQYVLLALLAIALLVAAFTDIRSRQIANWLNGAVALGAPLFWWASGLAPVARCRDPARRRGSDFRGPRHPLRDPRNGRR